ncbi:MAG: helix-turn-helix transcriptional regulator [Bacteroides sp.]
MRYIEHIFRGTENELEDWKKLLGGKINGNTLYVPEGTIKEYKFDSHKIIIIRLLLTEEINAMRIMDKSSLYYPIIFSECLTFEPGDVGKTRATFSKSLSTGIYFSNEKALIQFPKGQELSLILFRVRHESFERVLPEKHDFLKYIQTDDSYFFYESISVEMKILMQHLQNCVLPEKLDYEFACARSWELFLLFADKFFYQRKNRYKQIDKQLLQKLQHVKEFMLSDLSSPKSIEELTQFCGMSATKLRASFKEIYGMTIYNLFQEHRMEKARELLLEGDKSVSEVAYMLGYTHLGHFTGAFKHKYKCLPKHFKP